MGTVKHVYITHAPDGLSLTAFVEFETPDAVVAAKRKLDGANIYDGCCLIAVRVAQPCTTADYSTNIFQSSVFACAKRTGAAARESFRQDRPGRLMSPALYARGSASP